MLLVFFVVFVHVVIVVIPMIINHTQLFFSTQTAISKDAEEQASFPYIDENGDEGDDASTLKTTKTKTTTMMVTMNVCDDPYFVVTKPIKRNKLASKSHMKFKV